MEATALSVGKSVLNGALSYAKSALAEEVALQLGVRRNQLFITNELEMMQAFLMAAHDEGDDNKVVKVWVKQVRDVAYDVEDSLQEFAVRLQRQSWWRIRRTLLDRRRVAKQMKELRASVKDVSQRNMRYNLIKGSGSKAATAAEQSSITAAALFGIDEARRAAKQEKSKVDLVQLINEEENDLRVIAVWGTSADLGQMSIIRRVYENPDNKSKFSCRAWVRLMHPFNQRDFVQSLVEQFHAAVGVNVQLETEKTVQGLTDEFNRYVNKKRYLIVLNDLSTIEEWDRVKKCFPNNNMGSRIIVSTAQVEVASLCAGQESIVSELKQLYADQNIYAFYEKGSQADRTYLTKMGSSSNGATATTDNNPMVPIHETQGDQPEGSQDGTDLFKAGPSSRAATIITNNNSMVLTNEIQRDQSEGAAEKNIVTKGFARIQTMVAALEESHLFGREKDKLKIKKLVAKQVTEQFQVISVWGMGGLGKTTLVKDIYQNQELSGTFEKRACVTIMRPFILEELLWSLLMQLESSEKKDVADLMAGTKKTLSPAENLARLLKGKSCFIVLDDVSSAREWDKIIQIFPEMENTSRIIVTTREENIAKHCSKKQDNIYRLEGLEYKDARGLFTKKVFKKDIDLDKQYPELVKQAELILRKCDRLPLAIVTIGGFLANQPKTALEWRKLYENISAELEMNPELGIIRTVLMRSYDDLPYHLKSCFLYMSIFPEDHRVRRGRLVRRWSAEGYPEEVRGKSAEEISDSYFMKLINRSIILPSQKSIHSTKGIDSCQVHDLIREISISKSMEENLVFTLEGGCSSNSQAMVRHLVISSNWKGDKSDFESIVDMSRVRSITCFGKWRPFFISDKMRLLRVLDLEDTTGLDDHHLEHIGKLLHLRYLSLRGCPYIYHLPDSLGNLRQLETLDIRGTRIVMLPKTIIKLWKLNNVHAGRKPFNEDASYEEELYYIPQVMRRNRQCLLPLYSMLRCASCCVHSLIDARACWYTLPVVAMHLDLYGVLVPRGMRKLKALHTLGVVNIARRGKVILQDIKGLVQLRKLGVTGINMENGPELCTAIEALSRLESLSMRSEGVPGLSGCLDRMSSPPENLQSLKLYGNLGKLPEWIRRLENLVKLKLRSTMISDAYTAMQVLGNLPNLASLHLSWNSLQQGLCLNFHPAMFPSLVVLELDLELDPELDLETEESFGTVKFEEGATPKLELLKFRDAIIKSGWVSGLAYLSGLKEVVLQGYYRPAELEYLQAQLAQNPNRPVVKRV